MAEASLSISDSSFSGNSASDEAARFTTLARASISGSSFSGNSAEWDGGAIDNAGEASISISASSFSGNSSYHGSGGAIRNEGEANISISGSSFSDNSSYNGGAIRNDGEASISDISFSGNSAGSFGGAINNRGEASISDSSFSGNSATYYGGAIYNRGEASLNISGSSFSGNSARGVGGAIRNEGEASISGSSFSGNTASNGGALWLYGTATLSNLTLSGNSADESGGGIFVFEDAKSVSLRNSILADNTGGDCVNKVDLTESLNNIIKDGSCLDDMGIQADPMLGDWVEATETTTGYFPLLASSPAIDAAADSACADTDQLGNDRPHGKGCDIGAIEFQGEPDPASPAPEPAENVCIRATGDISVASYIELAEAIGCASDGDTIRLTGDITMSDHPPHIDKRITVEGAGHAISGNDQYRIFVVAQSGDLTINDLTLTKGSAGDGAYECIAGESASVDVGGAICNNGALSINDSSFSGNSAGYFGGAIYNRGEASLSISGSSFSGNSAKYGGGAIYNSQTGGASISGSSFRGNSASSGGAISNTGEANISGSRFSGNSAGSYGGAIANYGSEARLSVSVSSFGGNSAPNGGAIANWGEASISGSSFSGNSAYEGGAIANDGEASISDSSFSGNSADDKGGAIYNGDEASLSISGSSFSGNSAGYDGGAMWLHGTATLSNLTLSGNSAGEDRGGGIFFYDDAKSVRLRNSILADNEGGDCRSKALATTRNNIIKDGSCLDNTGIQADPMLGDWVEATDTTTGYFPLLEGSPAIDAAAESACSETDQLGNARPHGKGCDIGAIEFQGEPEPAAPADASRESHAPLIDIQHVACTPSDIYFILELRQSAAHPEHLLEVNILPGSGAQFANIMPLPEEGWVESATNIVQTGAGYGMELIALIPIIGEPFEVLSVLYSTAELGAELAQWADEQFSASESDLRFKLTWYHTGHDPTFKRYIVHAKRTSENGDLFVASAIAPRSQVAAALERDSTLSKRGVMEILGFLDNPQMTISNVLVEEAAIYLADRLALEDFSEIAQPWPLCSTLGG